MGHVARSVVLISRAREAVVGVHNLMERVAGAALQSRSTRNELYQRSLRARVAYPDKINFLIRQRGKVGCVSLAL